MCEVHCKFHKFGIPIRNSQSNGELWNRAELRGYTEHSSQNIRCPRRLLNSRKRYFHFQVWVIPVEKRWISTKIVRLIDACDGTFSGKQSYSLGLFWVFISVNVGVGSLTTLHIIIYIIQHALTEWYFLICCFRYSLCKRKYQQFGNDLFARSQVLSYLRWSWPF